MDAIRLDLGCGPSPAPGYIGVDARHGGDDVMTCLRLTEPDTVDEIRASHVVEHLLPDELSSFFELTLRALKPGGSLYVAVPDWNCIVDMSDEEGDWFDPKWKSYLMGGHIDKFDVHHSVWTESLLRRHLTEAGYQRVRHWTSRLQDCASLPVSLNLAGTKPVTPEERSSDDEVADLKIAALMSLPRVGFNDSWGAITEALSPFRIPCHRFTGAYWAQGMERMLDGMLSTGVDWALTIDYDSLFTARQLDRMFGILGNNPHIDALAALQTKRHSTEALMTVLGNEEGRTDVTTDEPIKVTTAHFGCTLIRVDLLASLIRPWFLAEPAPDGTWGEGHMDPDIMFWHRWRGAGHNIYVDPGTRIGHLEVMVTSHNERFQHQYQTVSDWRLGHGLDRTED